MVIRAVSAISSNIKFSKNIPAAPGGQKVEMTGIEPVTCGLQSHRSPN
jgi:hypothetical protein